MVAHGQGCYPTRSTRSGLIAFTPSPLCALCVLCGSIVPRYLGNTTEDTELPHPLHVQWREHLALQQPAGGGEVPLRGVDAGDRQRAVLRRHRAAPAAVLFGHAPGLVEVDVVRRRGVRGGGVARE